MYHGNHLYTANAGDSRGIVIRITDTGRIKGIPLTRDHKPSDLDESQRIFKAGGRIEAFTDHRGEAVGP